VSGSRENVSYVRPRFPLDLQNVDGFEVFAENGFAGAADPTFEQRGVDLTEIDLILKIAVVKFVEAWVFTDQSGADFRSRKEHRSSRAVVGSFAGIFRDTPTEFAERHHQRTIAMAVMRDVFDEGAYRAAGEISGGGW